MSILSIRDSYRQLCDLNKRKEAILKSLIERELLSEELEVKIKTASSLSILEDVYLPYKPKRKTRASAAKEKGLEPLAKLIFNQADGSMTSFLQKYTNEEISAEDALNGAKDIIAEWISEDSTTRQRIRNIFQKRANMSYKVVKKRADDATQYRDYFDGTEPISKAPSHRVLAALRGANEGFLKVKFLPDDDIAVNDIIAKYHPKRNDAGRELINAIEDSYKRLLAPSMETETKNRVKERAEETALQLFADNLKELLMASPLGQKRILAIDPGMRTGCKIAILSEQGSIIENSTIYPVEPHNKVEESSKIVYNLVDKYRIEAIAIGNGTGGRETLSFIEDLELPNIIITLVNEAGASVYSASEIAREELGDYDLTVRGAVSIGRRLMDPLAELVKIDPKSIGVGQYQHDIDQKKLKEHLDDVVISCVNSVGVDINTASAPLLSYVSGLNSKSAKEIVKARDINGPFKLRSDLKKVKGIGAKAFEQSAGFLRIPGGKNILDSSGVHPERYDLVKQISKDLNCSVEDLVKSSEYRKRIDINNYKSETTGLATLKDIINELEKPGRDPRESFSEFHFAKGINSIEEVEKGMKLPGIITNVTGFGAFVDIGVHQDGLIHISKMADRFISHPQEIVKVNQQVEVTVIECDVKRKRISLSLID